MKRFILEKSQETLAVIMAGAMLFGNPQPFLPKEIFAYSVENQEENFTRKRSRKNNGYGVNTSGKQTGYTRNPRNGFGRPNTPFPIRNEE